MRLMSVGFGMAMLLASSAALAAGGGAGSGSSTKGDTGGKGGLGPENSLQSGAQGTSEQSTAGDTSISNLPNKSTPSNPDEVAGAQVVQKAWEISATWETHRLLEQTGPTLSEQEKTFNVMFAALRYSLTDNDILSLSDGFQQFYSADPGEPGLRLSDISLAYTHIFQLPAKFRLSTTVFVTAPVGYYSQLATNITTPGANVGISRRFGDLTLSAGIRGSYSWDRYSTSNAIGSDQGSTTSANGNEGAGQPNNQWSAGGYISAEYDMPFHHPLSVGALVTDGYNGFYAIGNTPPYGTTYYGATTNPVTDNNPWQQSYGGEVFVRYAVPDLSGFKSDLLLALGNGDPSLGYPSVLHDGVVHPYFLYYDSAEVYFALEGRY
jgi:hypothetical protein